MGARSGLGPLETAALRAVREGDGADGWIRGDRLLDALEGGVGWFWPVVRSVAVPWRVHLRLLEGDGNLGFWDDSPADPEHVRFRLSPLGALELHVEDGDLGTAPFGLIEGTAYRDGWQPAFEPGRITAAVRGLLEGCDLEAAVATAGAPVSPSGGVLTGDVGAVLRGEDGQFLRVAETSRIERGRTGGRDLLVITGLPIGVDPSQVDVEIAEAARAPRSRDGSGGGWMADLRDESTVSTGLRVVVVLRREVDPDAAEAWLRGVRLVTVDVRRQLPASLPVLLQRAADAARPDPSGLHALHALV